MEPPGSVPHVRLGLGHSSALAGLPLSSLLTAPSLCAMLAALLEELRYVIYNCLSRRYGVAGAARQARL